METGVVEVMLLMRPCKTVVYACFVRRREKGKIKPRKVKRIKIPLSSDCQSISDGAKT